MVPRPSRIGFCLALWGLLLSGPASHGQGIQKFFGFAGSRETRPACDVPVPSCAEGVDKCQPPCGPCQPRKGPPPVEEREGPQQVEVGGYMAPPRVGAYRAPTVRRGFEGGSLIFPEIKLKLPSLELPCRYHSRSGPRMMIEEDVAPYEVQGYAVTTPRAAPRGDDCEERLRKCQEQLAELQRELEQMRRGGPEAGKRSPQQKDTPDSAYPQAPEPDDARRESSYPEVPAAFPERPAAYARPIETTEPPRHFITEPKKPAARITSLRPVE